MSSVNPTHKEVPEVDTKEIDSVRTTTGRLVLFNRQNARERISSELTMEVEP